MSANPSENVVEAASHNLFVALVEHWNRKAKILDEMANDAAFAGDWITEQRCETKAGTIRSLAHELRQAISSTNSQADTP